MIHHISPIKPEYIKKFNSYNNGYNDTKGGPINPMDCENVKHRHDIVMSTDEVRYRISKSMKESIARKGGVSNETRKKQSSNMLGNQHWKGRNVYCIDVDGNVVAEFDQVAKAARWWIEQGYKSTTYSAVIDSIRRNAKRGSYYKGLKWIYRTPDSPELP